MNEEKNILKNDKIENFENEIKVEKEEIKKVNRTRNKAFNVRLTDLELKKINRKIAASKLSKADFLVAVSEEKNVFLVDGLKEFSVEIKKQGHNINQLNRTLNSILKLAKEDGKIGFKLTRELEKALEEIKKIEANHDQIKTEFKNKQLEIKEGNVVLNVNLGDDTNANLRK